MPEVTALRAAGRGRVAVELDGTAWRVLPLEAVLAAGLAEGVPLDRRRARRLAQELRRGRAAGLALRALGRRDLTRARLDERLARGGVAPADRAETVARLERVGLVDDGRLAHGRAEALAARGWGDARIRDDLERQGVPADAARAAVEALEPEGDRAARLVSAAGASPQTLRRLARAGFAEDSLDPFVADVEP